MARNLRSKPFFSVLLEDESACQSQRSAIIGSTFVARRAGIKQASSAMVVSKSVITANVSGSVALTANSSFATDASTPMQRPDPTLHPLL